MSAVSVRQTAKESHMKKIIFLLLGILISAAVVFSEINYKGLELPAYSRKDQIIRHKFYTLKYNEKYEQADWVAYRLTAEQSSGKLKRKGSFKADPAVRTGSASPADYRKSGYTRGHLAPAADMKFSPVALEESFYMSNMTPQTQGFNAGIWGSLEKIVRKWAVKEKEICVVAGGILKGNMKTIGNKNKIAVPEYFYKVVLDCTEPEIKGIGFIVPHKKSKEDIMKYALTIDKVEKETGINFFPALPDAIEKRVESSVDLNKWRYKSKDGKKYLKNKK